MKHIITVTIAILSLSISGIAQPNHYVFQEYMSTYHELTDDSLIEPANFGNGDLFAFELNGETYSFFNKNYHIDGATKLIMFSNSGHMRVDDDSTFIIVDGIFTYLDSIDNTSRLSYKIEGTGNNKVLKVQWKNLKIRHGMAGNYVNFQMWLYKSTGTFEIHYGLSSTNNQSGYTNANGPHIGLFYSLQNFTKMFEKIWITGDLASYSIDSTRNASFKTIHGVPTSGTVYRFITKAALSTSNLQIENVKLIAYPNPANKEIIIKSSTIKPINILVTDVSGKHILSTSISGNLNTLDVTNWAPGIYKIQFRSDEKEYNQQILIQH